jgi:hypothetical protein
MLGPECYGTIKKTRPDLDSGRPQPTLRKLGYDVAIIPIEPSYDRNGDVNVVEVIFDGVAGNSPRIFISSRHAGSGRKVGKPNRRIPLTLIFR